jgi:5'-phosphate synthase pdxT subunit
MRADPSLPVLGTCAGVILLADPQDGGEPLIHSSIDRNAYGRQQDSFQAELTISGIGDSNIFSGVFIRAPRFAEISANDAVVATHQDEVVGVRNGARLALTFHPELSDDTTFHRWLLEAALLRATA